MGDREAVVGDSSAMMDYTSAAYNSTGSDAYLSEATGDPVASGVPAGGAHAASGCGFNSAGQEGRISAIYDSKLAGGSTNENAAAAGNTASDASKAAGYNSSLNGNVVNEAGSAATVENGNVFDNMGAPAAAPEFMDGFEDRLWSIVRANSLYFKAWAALIEETEKVSKNNILTIRLVYDAFFAEFLLCYGYWKKYVNHEARRRSIDEVVEVYGRAVQAVTYYVGLWVLYCAFSMETYGDSETIRRLFERGLAYVGTDYLSSPLWDKYIEYEYMHQEWSRFAVIYSRLLEDQNQELDRYFNSKRTYRMDRKKNMTANEIPDDIWRKILQYGTRSSQLTFIDLCNISKTSRKLKQLSNEDSLWIHLISSDFRRGFTPPSAASYTAKPLYRMHYDKYKKERKGYYRHCNCFDVTLKRRRRYCGGRLKEIPNEIWRKILQDGTRSSKLTYKDLCNLSKSSRRLYELSKEDSLWIHLLSSDFPRSPYKPPSTSFTKKTIYRMQYGYKTAEWWRYKPRILRTRRLVTTITEEAVWVLRY